jgi:hypothetical protein
MALGKVMALGGFLGEDGSFGIFTVVEDLVGLILK